MQAAGRIEEDHVVAVPDGVGNGGLGDIDRVRLPHLEDRDSQLFADDLQLLDRGRAVDIAGGEQRIFVLFLKSPASLAPLVVLPAPCRPTSMTTVGGCEAILTSGFRCP